MADNEKSGVKAALSQMDAGSPPKNDAVQLTLDALLPKPHLEGQESELLDTDPNQPGERGAGRPPGSTNIATREMAEFLDRQYTNPLTTLSKIAHIDPFELVRAIRKEHSSIKAEQVLSFWKECALSILPYRAKKQPIAVDLTGKGSFSLILEDPAPLGRDDDEADVMATLLAVSIEGKVVENKTAGSRQLVDVTPEKSDADQSDTQPKPLENNEE